MPSSAYALVPSAGINRILIGAAIDQPAGNSDDPKRSPLRLVACSVCRSLPHSCRCLHDIRDPHAFVHGTIRRARLVLSADELAELHATGMVILHQLAKRYRPHIEGHEGEGRFSGYAAMYLPRKLGDAWHTMHPEHQHVTGCICKTGPKWVDGKCENCGGEEGKRRWLYRERPVSLEAITADDPDRHPVMASEQHTVDLERRLRAALIAQARVEVDWVVKIAKRIARGEQPRAVAAELGLDLETVDRHMRTSVRALPHPRHQWTSTSELRAALELLAERDADRASQVGQLFGEGATSADAAEVLTHRLRAAGEILDWQVVELSEIHDHEDALRRVAHAIESGNA